jgi:hypothetical protein
MPNLALMLWLSQKLVEAHVRRQQKNVSIHHVASLMASLHRTEKIVRKAPKFRGAMSSVIPGNAGAINWVSD